MNSMMISKNRISFWTRYIVPALSIFFILITISVVLTSNPAYSDEQVYTGDSKDDPQDESADYGE